MDKKEKLNTPHQTQVMILGTSHIAKESIDKIREVFIKDRPDFVCVELDKGRLQALLSEKKKSISLSTIKRVGFTGFIFSLIGGFVQKKLGKFVGLEPGSDMLSAIKMAQEYGARVVLIDQNIEYTLRRLSEEFSFMEKIRFLFDIIKSIFLPRKELEELGIRNINISKIPSCDLVNIVIQKIRKRYPGLYKTLIRERNEYMFHNILKICQMQPGSKVLVVVGAGHEEGLKELFDEHTKSMASTIRSNP